jgi:glycosyltransferase involved in cell wall biosynthesis
VAARLSGVKAICWGIRSSNLDIDKTHWMTRLVRRTCALMSHIVPQLIFLNSEAASEIHASLGYSRGKMFVLPNGFDLTRFKPDKDARRRVRESLGYTDNTPLVGMLGRFDPLKNHFGIITAMSVLHGCIPGAHLIMAGNGVDRGNSELVHAINQAGLCDKVHLLGEREDVSDLMASFDVLACPSYAEAFPNVVGEAMATGVPCVVTDVGDCAYIVGDTGRVVVAGDMAAFASSIQALLNLSQLHRNKLGEEARARVQDLFEIGCITRRYEEAYKSLWVVAR